MLVATLPVLAHSLQLCWGDGARPSIQSKFINSHLDSILWIMVWMVWSICCFFLFCEPRFELSYIPRSRPLRKTSHEFQTWGNTQNKSIDAFAWVQNSTSSKFYAIPVSIMRGSLALNPVMAPAAGMSAPGLIFSNRVDQGNWSKVCHWQTG